MSVPAAEALARLRAGNGRFVVDQREFDAGASHTRRAAVANSQEPFAIVLGCSDSRVPAEVIFDHAFGDLFVIRVAGNIVAPSQVGSVEFAATRFGTRLVVVLGHTQCGAVTAALEALSSAPDHSANLQSIVDRIRPSVETVLAANGAGADPARILQLSVRANVRASADHLRHGSAILERLIARDGLLVVGAEYSLETGEVDFFDVPGGASRRSGE
jgi:carbonic anhydrase